MSEPGSTRASRWSWVVRTVAVLALAAVGWVLVTAWAPVVHGHPAYPVLLGLTVLGALGALWRARRPWARPGRWRLLGRVVLVALSVAWVGAMVWLRPFAAVQPALAAMRSDADVTSPAAGAAPAPTASSPATAPRRSATARPAPGSARPACASCSRWSADSGERVSGPRRGRGRPHPHER